MKLSDINIRDPYVLLDEDVYYLYGTRSATCWGPAEGFDCYSSVDLINWDGPFEIFHREEDFFATENYWAPECYRVGENFYFVTTLGAKDRKKAIYILKSNSPKGPFEFYAGPLTPVDWACIDGSLYFEEDIPYLLFSHSFEDGQEADISAIRLKEDLSCSVGDTFCLFKASEAKDWIKPVPFAEAEFGMKGDVYFTDGPCAMKLPSGKLYLAWSGWSVAGYAVGIAVSESGKITGPWKQLEKPLYPVDGGHGMLFRDKEGRLLFALHSPNEKYAERPHFYLVEEENGTLKLGAEV